MYWHHCLDLRGNENGRVRLDDDEHTYLVEKAV